MLFLLKYVDEKIALMEFENNQFNYIKKNGEEWQPFDKEQFWQWFKKKISYNDEKLSFIIISDTDTFTIDSTIQLSTTNSIQHKREIASLLTDELIAKTQLYYIPECKIATPQKVKKKQPIAKKGTLSEYYTNKTKLYRG